MGQSRTLLSIFTVTLFILTGCLSTTPARSRSTLSNSTSSDPKPTASPKPSPTNSVTPSPSPSASPGPGLPTNGTGGEIRPGAMIQFLDSSLYIPRCTQPSRAMPVLALFFIDHEDFVPVAEEQCFFILIPDFDASDTGLATRKFSAVWEELKRKYNIDRSRLYVSGYSAGGNYSLQLAANVENQKEIAGVLTFPGSGGQYLYDQCRAASNAGTRKVAIYYWVGDRDSIYCLGPNCKPGVMQEAEYIRAIPGYANRVKSVLAPGYDHVPPGVAERREAWNWIKQFTTQN